MKKATDKELLESYKKTKSVWKTGKELGMAGQTVHERLSKIGATNSQKITDSEADMIRKVYASGIIRGDGKLDALAKKIGRPKPNICRWARKHGLTKNKRAVTPTLSKEMSKNAKNWHSKNDHPKGFSGRSHTEKSKAIISESSSISWHGKTKQQQSEIVGRSMKTRLKKYGSLAPANKKGNWKSAWRVIGGVRKFYRSRWEANYARYLEFLRKRGEIDHWEHEPTTFWFEAIKRGARSYLPDFKVKEKGIIYYVEVKGWMDARSKTKIKRMKKYHPEVELRVVDSKAYTALEKKIKPIIPDWE